jgi:polysaccharide export outer membrane protein
MSFTCRIARAIAIAFVSSLTLVAVTSVAQTQAPGSLQQRQNDSMSATPGSASSSATPSNGGHLSTAEAPFYHLIPGDTLDVTVFGAPELSQRVRVTSNGEVYLPLVNYVHVGGLDIQGAQASIEGALKKGNFVVSPHVTVVVAEFASGVTLMGEVMRPGLYSVTASNGRLLDIITEAGGTTPNAGPMVAITHRDNTPPQTVYLSHDPDKAMEANVPVSQGDTIMVSKAGTIFVVGEVIQPSAFIMESRSGYTALKALAMAHGATRMAKLSSAKIIRQTPKGVEEIPVPLDKIAQNKAPDTELIADDILLVPTSHGKVAAAQAISMAQSIAVFGAAHTF